LPELQAKFLAFDLQLLPPAEAASTSAYSHQSPKKGPAGSGIRKTNFKTTVLYQRGMERFFHQLFIMVNFGSPELLFAAEEPYVRGPLSSSFPRLNPTPSSCWRK
jgi:hypothetical protein